MNRDSLMTLGGLVLVVAVVVATFLYGQHQQQDQKNHDRQLQQQATATQPAPAPASAASSAPQQPGVQKPASDSTGQSLQGSKESGAAAPGNVTAPAKPQPAPQTAKKTPATGANSSPATAVVPPAETPKTGGEVLYIAGVVITMGAGYRLRRSRAAVRAAQLRA